MERRRNAVLAAGWFTLLGGLVSFLGWAGDWRRLTDWIDSGISIQPNATLAVILAGASLVLLEYGHRRVVTVLGILVGLLGATALIQYVTPLDLRWLNTLLVFGREWGRTGVMSPGRMGPPGSSCWTLIGIALFLLSRGPRWSRRAVPILGLGTMGIATLAITGYLYHASVFYAEPTLTVIALQTAVFILAVSIGLVASVPESGPTRLLRDDGTAGYIARRATPLILAVAFILGLLRLIGQQAGLFDLTTGTAARTLVEAALLLGILFWSLVIIRRQEDILRESRERLREADRRKDEFLATLAHELRAPLAPMRNTLEILTRLGDGNPLQRQARETMQRQLRHLVRLVDDLIDVNRIAHDKIELRKEPVDLASVLHQALEATQPLVQSADVRLRVQLPPEPLYLDADPMRLAQVFGNVLTNACKYTPAGGEILVLVAHARGEAVVCVKDTGIGIPAHQLQRIFELFAQVDSSLEKTHGGLGIGLTLVKQLVELHGGSVSARSEGPGRGSEFVVRLPLSERSVPPVESLRAPPAPSRTE